MSSTGNTFQYRPLKGGTSEFRILHLVPGHWNEPISCFLEHANLDHPPLYEPLSYAVGDPTVTESIQLVYADSFFRMLLGEIFGLDTKITKGSNQTIYPILFVTTNLVKALRQLRKEGAPRRIWADAICINQADLRERSEQVRKMQLIYSRAPVVTIWLGELQDKAANLSESDMRSAFSYLRGILERHFSKDINNLAAFFESLSKTELPMDRTLLRALSSLCRRPWFTRVWVVQEQVLARLARVLYGDEWLSFEQFMRAMKAVSHVLELQEPSTLNSSLAVVGHVLFRREFRSPKFLELPIGERVLAALQLAGVRLRATDPRDKLYGLIGLLGDVNECPILVPDYEKPLDEFWLNLTKFLILETSSLCFLQQPDPGASPSWVAKWERGLPYLEADTESGKIYDAVKQHTVIRFSPNGMCLYTKVITLGQVSDYVFVHHDLGQDLTYWRDEMKSLEARLEAIPAVLEKYKAKQSIKVALRDLVTMKMDDSQIRDSVELRKRYMMLMGRLPPDSSSSPKQKTLAAEDLSNLHRKSLPHTLEFFILSSGHIGLIEGRAADATSHNHGVAKVCIFPGVVSLFELVPDGHAYRLSSTCLVHGYEYMSAKDMLEMLEKTEWEDISLV